MNIPIQNIYYLLCYAWDKLAEKDVVAVDSIDTTTLADLFARVLINGTNHLLKRGFDRGYVWQHEWTGRLRGRICFQEAIRRNATVTGMLPCDFDELSYNVLHNRILKATMRRLIRTQGLATECSEGLTHLCRLFSDIQDIELSSRLFGQVQLHRNNQFYDFLLKVCELIYRNLLVSEKPGSSKFMDFVQDKRQMAILFESFVRTFYRVHTDFRVRREDIYWRWIAADQVAAGLLPKMQTDISLTSDTRKIIIDCKFTPEATQQHFEAVTLRSSHMFQINAYMDNLEGEWAETCEMMLLYPTVDSPLSADYTHKRHNIRIRTINLNQPWQGIHDDLLQLVGVNYGVVSKHLSAIIEPRLHRIVPAQPYPRLFATIQWHAPLRVGLPMPATSWMPQVTTCTPRIVVRRRTRTLTCAARMCCRSKRSSACRSAMKRSSKR